MYKVCPNLEKKNKWKVLIQMCLKAGLALRECNKEQGWEIAGD